MKTELLHTLTRTNEDAAVAAAVAALHAGDVVALPTETVYGLAADATRPEAVAKVFEAKDRPRFDPLIVHLPDDSWLERVVVLPEDGLAAQLATLFWPGPLTIVLPRREIVPDIVTAGLDTVAVRRSAHPVFQRVLHTFGKPLAAPSANRFGRISPTLGAHVMLELSGRIPLVVDGGPTDHGVESTIVSVEGGRIQILRPGPVTEEMLADFAPVTKAAAAGTAPIAPGQLESHYAPNAPLEIRSDLAAFRPPPQGRCGLLAWSTDVPTEPFTEVQYLSRKQDLAEAATHLFAALRELDAAGLDLIVAEPVPETGLGIAIMDRLRRAAGDRGRRS